MKLRQILLATAISSALPAFAQQLACNQSFAFRADSNGVQGSTLCNERASTFLDAAQQLSLSNVKYTPVSAASVQARFADVSVAMSYPENSAVLTFSMPELALGGTFNGGNREASQQLLVDYLKSSNVLGRIMNYQAKHSATSGITGMGGSIPMAGAADFSSSFDAVSQIGSAPRTAGSEGGNNLIGVGLGYATYNIDGSGEQVKATNLPLSYTIRNQLDPRSQLVINLPLSQVKIGNASTYHAGLGVAYRFPLSDRWTLTPGVKYSIVASVDRATVSTVASGSLMSTYVVPLDGGALAIGNMLGYYKTGKFERGDYKFDPDIALKMTRNGAMYSLPLTVIGTRLAAEFSLIDTRYLGEKPYVTDTQEVGVTLGTNRNANNARSFTRVGLSYIHGKNTNGVSANVGFWF